jgi:hypothetical protein
MIKYANTYFHVGNNEIFTCWYLMNINKKWRYIPFTNSESGKKRGNEEWNYFEKEY